MEFAVAKWVYEELKALPDLERVSRFLDKRRNHETHPLTLCELQVLGRMVSGKPNNPLPEDCLSANGRLKKFQYY